MFRFLMALVLVCALTNPVYAQYSVAGGGSKDFVKVGTDAEWTEVVTPMAALAYNLPLKEKDGKVVQGLTLGFRGSDGTDLVQEYSFGFFEDTRYFRWFIDGVMPVWGKDFTGEREFLYGGRAGLRATATGGAPVEMSFMYSGGTDDKAQLGIFFGLRLES